MSLRLICLISVVLSASLTAANLRVVTFNIEANRDSNGFVTESLNDPGTSDYESVRDILERINADVVCLQELANADVAGGTNGGTNSDVHSLASDLGLPYVHIPTSSGVFDFSLRNAILSRYPIIETEDIGSAGYMEAIISFNEFGIRAKDVSRAKPAVKINVPGAASPVTIIGLHNKAGSAQDDSLLPPSCRTRKGQPISLTQEIGFRRQHHHPGRLQLSTSQ